MQKQIDGVLLLDKPMNMTSNAALQRVKRLFHAKKAGHTGSLDPIATGMLPVCFGEATKYSQFLLDSNKTYHVIAQLGIQTTTGDREGEVTLSQPIIDITRERVQEAMKKFTGEIAQIPPMYSAIKYQGKPLYKLARRGIEIDRKPRLVTIISLSLESLEQDQLSFQVHCSKGTYVRTLVQDLGCELGCGAHVKELRRLTVTPYHHHPMYTLSTLEEMVKTKRNEVLSTCLLPVETAVEIFPAVQLSTSAAFYLRMGQPIRLTVPFTTTLVRLISDDDKFLGIGEVIDGLIKPRRLLASPELPAALIGI